MKKFNRGDVLEVNVDRLSVGGRGVSRHEGLVIFTPNTAPNETCKVELTFVKKNFAEGRLLEVVKPSLARRTPPCPVADVCGGCNWQHIDYAEQLHQKTNLVAESLKRFAAVENPLEKISAIVPSPREFNYRNRIQLHFAGDVIGYHRRGSHKLVSIDHCPIAEEKINQEIPRLREDLKSLRPGRIEVYVGQDGQLHRRAPVFSEPSRDDDSTVSEATGPAFSQVNTGQNQNLIQFVLKQFESHAGERGSFYDLYSGSGNFTFPLADMLPEFSMDAVEMNPESVVLGSQIAASEYAQRKIQFHQSPVEVFLRRHKLERDALVLLDPPRAGCGDEVMQELVKAPISKIVYVSCHPVTLSRDLKVLLQAGFHLDEVKPFDMFPQTDHVECVAILSR